MDNDFHFRTICDAEAVTASTCTICSSQTVAPKIAEARDDGKRSQLHLELVRDFAPVGAAENILVAELARRAVNMELWSAAACAVREAAASSLAEFGLTDIASPQHSSAVLAAAASCEAVDRAERTSTAQNRTLVSTLKLLLELQARRQSNEAVAQPTVSSPKFQFDSEIACTDYLVDWRQCRFNCDGCGHRQAHWIRSRKCLECAACGSQSGLRVGTVMADSSLPLVIWFLAVWLVVFTPTITTSDLTRRLGLSRAATARDVAQRIRAALTADDRTTLLAGLDCYFATPEFSVPPLTKRKTTETQSDIDSVPL